MQKQYRTARVVPSARPRRHSWPCVSGGKVTVRRGRVFSLRWSRSGGETGPRCVKVDQVTCHQLSFGNWNCFLFAACAHCWTVLGGFLEGWGGSVPSHVATLGTSCLGDVLWSLFDFAPVPAVHFGVRQVLAVRAARLLVRWWRVHLACYRLSCLWVFGAYCLVRNQKEHSPIIMRYFVSWLHIVQS